MRMATRRRRRWIAIGGATAAVAIGVWAAVALGDADTERAVTHERPRPSHLDRQRRRRPDAASYSVTARREVPSDGDGGARSRRFQRDVRQFTPGDGT